MDLKSQNILLNRDHTVAKIADVGLSRGIQSSLSNLSVGTLEYSAPEVLLGRYCNEKVSGMQCFACCWSFLFDYCTGTFIWMYCMSSSLLR